MPVACPKTTAHAACWSVMAKGLQGFLWTVLLLFCAVPQQGAQAVPTEVGGPGLGQPGDPALLAGGRVKRGWVWNQFFVVEEYTGTEPLYVGKIHSDSDEGDGSIKYTISGEGAGTIFLIDELTGDIHATERLDREQKTFYTLRAQARDRQTDRLLEPESEFIIKVQDINDSEPRFLEGPYIGSVAELSPVGTSVMQVMASDADDPTYGSSARVVYSVLEGEQHFTVDRQTGVIRTAVADLDRETQDRYEVVIRATDMAGQLGGLSGSTTVTIVVTDVNDNPPRFPQKMYQFSVVETAPVGTAIGRVKAEDSDVGENTDMTYQMKDEEGVEMFKVTTDSNTQEAVITVQKPLDYESKKVHTVVVEALNKFVDPRFVDLGTFRDQTIVRVSVLDVDEPPEFRPPSDLMEVQEDAHVGSVVGVVTALDPDTANHPVRYAIDRSTDVERIFDIDANTGAIVTGKVLDRETAGWHNITVLAMEADNHSQVSRASLRIRILDVNDNPPELATPYEAAVCEDAKPGQLVQTISVVDRDEPQSGHRFYFTLAPEATHSHHFSLLDVKDNTAAVHTQRVGFNRQEQDVYLLPILVVDSGPPALSSTGTLTIRVCGCDSSGAIQSCNSTAYVMSATLSPGALIALLVCILILIESSRLSVQPCVHPSVPPVSVVMLHGKEAPGLHWRPGPSLSHPVTQHSCYLISLADTNRLAVPVPSPGGPGRLGCLCQRLLCLCARPQTQAILTPLRAACMTPSPCLLTVSSLPSAGPSDPYVEATPQKPPDIRG
ncbi:cadherin-22 isoform X2 [Struthio camelus]|uniref:cadherin-22 isoform X2 n=1 Tax=Struthio camelus TaxID=8801 RepID=UPI003603D382